MTAGRRLREGARLIGLAALLAAAGPSPARSQAPVSAMAGPPAASGAEKLRPLRFPAIARFVDAIAIEAEAAHLADQFWQPAIAALVAANPAKAAAARAFAAEQRAAELALYRPLVELMLDGRAVELLDPEVERRLEELQEKQSAEFSRTRAIPEERRRAYHAEMLALMARPAARADAQLLELARLALTADGMALRELNRQGLYLCLGEPRRFAPEGDRARCAALESAPALQRLRSAPSGNDLIRLSTAANITLVGMMQMGHAAGISLHSLLPPEKVRAAGLEVPADRSFEDLVNTYATKAPRR